MSTAESRTGRPVRLRRSSVATPDSASALVRRRGVAFLAILACLLVFSAARAEGASAYYLLSVSTSADRSNPVTLGGQSYAQSASIYVFIKQNDGVDHVDFYLDDTDRSGSPHNTERIAPYDFTQTGSGGLAIAYPLSALPAGRHTITSVVHRDSGGTETDNGTFTVQASSLRFQDNFDGSSLNTTVWSPYVSAGHAGNGLRRASAFSVANGLLTVTAKMVDGRIVSGGMKHRSDYTYGRYEFRVRTEVDPTGTMSGVVLTWPKYQWSPEFTENDIYETGAAANTRWPFRTFIHYGTSNSQKHYIHEADASDWQTMVMDWRKSALKIYRDGALVWQTTDSWVIPDVLHHISIQLDARHERTLTRAVRMYVDYIRIYA